VLSYPLLLYPFYRRQLSGFLPVSENKGNVLFDKQQGLLPPPQNTHCIWFSIGAVLRQLLLIKRPPHFAKGNPEGAVCFRFPAAVFLLLPTASQSPLAKPYFEKIRPALLRAVCKLLLCNGAVLAMYGLVLLLVPAGSIAEELRTTALAVSLVTLAMGNVAFLLYDRALHNMLMLYHLVWQPKLHKMLGVH